MKSERGPPICVTILHIEEHGEQYLPSDRICLNGFTGHLMRECGENIQDGHFVEMASSRPWNFRRDWAAKNVGDLQQKPCFDPTYRSDGNTTHCQDNWICYDFKTQQIFPTHYSIRVRHDGGVNSSNVKSWIIEIFNDG
jgi:hypothetical protein